MLVNNIISNTIHSIVVCVDFLGTHMASLVSFEKWGVIEIHAKKACEKKERNNIHAKMYVRKKEKKKKR
jgi:hypothetical protein